MDAAELRALQAPIKERYKNAPEAALITLRARGTLDDMQIACDLPRPRDRQSAAFDFVKRRVLAALDRSLNRAIVTDDGETKAASGGGLWW